MKVETKSCLDEPHRPRPADVFGQDLPDAAEWRRSEPDQTCCGVNVIVSDVAGLIKTYSDQGRHLPVDLNLRRVNMWHCYSQQVFDILVCGSLKKILLLETW